MGQMPQVCCVHQLNNDDDKYVTVLMLGHLVVQFTTLMYGSWVMCARIPKKELHCFFEKHMVSWNVSINNAVARIYQGGKSAWGV